MNKIESLLDDLVKIDNRINLDMFEFALSQTQSFEEVKLLMVCLKKHGFNFSKKRVFEDLMKLSESLENSRFVLYLMDKHNIKPTLRMYFDLINSADTCENLEEVLQELEKKNIDIPLSGYFDLILKQDSYMKAKKTFEDKKNIFQHIDSTLYYAILLKADQVNDHEEIKRIRNEMHIAGIDFNINRYNLYYDKTFFNKFNRKDFVKKYRDVLLNRSMNSKKLLNYKEVNTFNGFTEFSNTSSTFVPKEEKMVTVFKRNNVLVNELKQLYDNTCQICGEKLCLGKNNFYSEVHHIQPLSLEGPDILENMIVVCPNHHKLFDRGVITINLVYNKVKHIDPEDCINELTLNLKHRINEKYINHHNSRFFST